MYAVFNIVSIDAGGFSRAAMTIVSSRVATICSLIVSYALLTYPASVAAAANKVSRRPAALSRQHHGRTSPAL